MLGQKESFKTQLFLGENRGGTPILSHFPYFCQFWPKFPETCRFLKVFELFRWEKEKIFLCQNFLKMDSRKYNFGLWNFYFFILHPGGGGLEGM